MLFLLLVIFIGLIFLAFQSQKYVQLNRAFQQAKELEAKGSAILPYDIHQLSRAYELYQKCYQSAVFRKAIYLRASEKCQHKINDYCQYYEILDTAQEYNKQSLLHQELDELIKSESIFKTEESRQKISKCQEDIKQKQKYALILPEIQHLANQGEFQAAIDLLLPFIDRDRTSDAKQFLTKLEIAINTKDLYRQGLIAEKNHNIPEAIAYYQSALDLVPEFVDCRLRLAIIKVEHHPQAAINRIAGINSEQANYIRGFAYAKLENWQQTKQIWQSVDNSHVKVQLQTIAEIKQKECLKTVSEIERLIDLGELELAQSISQELCPKFGSNSIVSDNLNNHIKPILNRQLWDSQDWNKIAEHSQKVWWKKQDIESLHNWAIATYYQSQINISQLNTAIIIWLTALANLKLNPRLHNIPWLDDDAVILNDLEHQLQNFIESILSNVKDKDINKYFELRDIYHWDMTIISMLKKNNCGIKNKNNLLILPSFYQCFKASLPSTNLPTNLWGALYTDWGLAIAASQANDIDKVIKTKPQQIPLSEAEYFADCFLAYYISCHYLENLYWRKAIKGFQKARSEIIINSDWCNNIDRLCQIQYQHLDDFTERLEFCEAWYLLIDTKLAKKHYVEHQAMQVSFDVNQGIINCRQALSKLEKLVSIAPNNSLIIDTIDTLEANLELEKINYLWQHSEYEAAVEIARQSALYKVRYAVAEVCLSIVLEILQSESLTNESIKSIEKTTKWAYELCPHESSFQALYLQLKQLGIHY